MATITVSPGRTSGGGSIKRISLNEPSLSSSLGSSLTKLQTALDSQRRSAAQLQFEQDSQTDPIGARQTYIKFLQGELSGMIPGSADANRMQITIDDQNKALAADQNAQSLAELEYQADTGAATPQDKIDYYNQALALATPGTTDYYRLQSKIVTAQNQADSVQQGKEDYLYNNGYMSASDYLDILKQRVDNAKTDTEYRTAANALSNFEKTQDSTASSERIREAEQEQASNVGGDKVAEALKVFTVIQDEYNNETDPTKKDELYSKLITAQNDYYSTKMDSQELQIRANIADGTMTNQDLLAFKIKRYQEAPTEQDALKQYLDVINLSDEIAKSNISAATKTVNQALNDIDSKITEAKNNFDYDTVAKLYQQKVQVFQQAQGAIPADDFSFWDKAQTFQNSLNDDSGNEWSLKNVLYRVSNPESYGILYDPVTGAKKFLNLVPDMTGQFVPADGSNVIKTGVTKDSYRQLFVDSQRDQVIDEWNKQNPNAQIPKPADIGLQNKSFIAGIGKDNKPLYGEIVDKNTPGAMYDPATNQYFTFRGGDFGQFAQGLKQIRDMNTYLGQPLYSNQPILDDKGKVVGTQWKPADNFVAKAVQVGAAIESTIPGHDQISKGISDTLGAIKSGIGSDLSNVAKGFQNPSLFDFAKNSTTAVLNPNASSVQDAIKSAGNLFNSQNIPNTAQLLASAFPTNPITDIANIPAVQDFVTKTLPTTVTTIKNDVGNVFKGIPSTLNTIKQNVGDAVHDISLPSLPPDFNLNLPSLDDIINKATSNFNFQLPKVNLPSVNIQSAANTVKNDVGGFFSNVGSTVHNALDDVVGGVKNFFGF